MWIRLDGVCIVGFKKKIRKSPNRKDDPRVASPGPTAVSAMRQQQTLTIPSLGRPILPPADGPQARPCARFQRPLPHQPVATFANLHEPPLDRLERISRRFVHRESRR